MILFVDPSMPSPTRPQRAPAPYLNSYGADQSGRQGAGAPLFGAAATYAGQQRASPQPRHATASAPSPPQVGPSSLSSVWRWGQARTAALATHTQRSMAVMAPRVGPAAREWGIILLSIGLHEFGHAYMAHRLGDASVRAGGHLTAWPIANMSFLSISVTAVLIGMQLVTGESTAKLLVVVPLIALVADFFFPNCRLGQNGTLASVPFSPAAFARPLLGIALTALAGPGASFAVAAACIFASTALSWAARGPNTPELEIGGDRPPLLTIANPRHSGVAGVAIGFLDEVAVVNATVGILNLMPVPGYDGALALGAGISALLDRFS